jgi:hypothetical protein
MRLRFRATTLCMLRAQHCCCWWVHSTVVEVNYLKV